VTRRHTFDNIPGWYDEVAQVTGAIPSVLIANKVDLVDQRQVSTEDAMGYAQQLGWGYFETSAKEGQGVTEGFRQIAWTCIS
jgi:GTPase SAR1 family protein